MKDKKCLTCEFQMKESIKITVIDNFDELRCIECKNNNYNLYELKKINIMEID